MAGPAVGARGQFGFSEETAWGISKFPIANFIEFRSESIKSELTSLTSTALRSDRGVYKQISGVENASGDVVVELGAQRYTKLIKHALGTDSTDTSLGSGAFKHQIRASAALPVGMTLEVHRDVAAFVYAGAKINTMNVVANPNEFLTATFGFMAKGGTTAGGPTADGSNTSQVPLIWGDYNGTDAGVTKSFYIKVSGAGAVDGTTGDIHFSSDGTAYGDAITPKVNTYYDIYTGAGTGAKTGFKILFTAATALVLGDKWTITSIRPKTAASNMPVVNPFSGFEGALTMDGAAAPIMGLTFTLNNNLYGDKYHLGERMRGMLPEQNRSVEGTVTVEFDDLDMYRKFLTRTPAALKVKFESATEKIATSAYYYALELDFPKVVFTGTTPTIGGPGIITVEMPFTALVSDSTATPYDLQITVWNDETTA